MVPSVQSQVSNVTPEFIYRVLKVWCHWLLHESILLTRLYSNICKTSQQQLSIFDWVFLGHYQTGQNVQHSFNALYCCVELYLCRVPLTPCMLHFRLFGCPSTKQSHQLGVSLNCNGKPSKLFKLELSQAALLSANGKGQFVNKILLLKKMQVDLFLFQL